MNSIEEKVSSLRSESKENESEEKDSMAKKNVSESEK